MTPEKLREFKPTWEVYVPPAQVNTSIAPDQPRLQSELGNVQAKAFYQRISDSEIVSELERILQCRFFGGFNARDEAKRLADKVEQAELAGGSRELRAKTLAWCARILSGGETVELAKQILIASNGLMETEEGKIADAVILSNADKHSALSRLHSLNTPLARSAALRLVINTDGCTPALQWAERAAINESNLNPEGKYAFCYAAMTSERWDVLSRIAETLDERDFASCVGLLHIGAMARLLPGVPLALRANVTQQVPPQPVSFPLSSEAAHVGNRRVARAFFQRIASYCHSVKLLAVANVASDYALWLALRDQETITEGLAELRESLKDPVQLLRRLNLALAYGIKIDIAEVERRIDQSVAFSGSGTADEAFARYALIGQQSGPKEAALYIAKHRVQLHAHLQKVPLLGVEVEVLARSGQITAAKERLNEAIAEGMGANEVAALSMVIAEASGKDPLAERRALYEATGDLQALRNLTDALDAKESWDDLLPYAQKLFTETHDVVDCLLVARTLDRLNRYRDLFRHLSENASLIQASVNLKAMWAWTLWREGMFAESNTVLGELSIYQKTESYRALRINLAISSGNWAALNAYCDNIWSERNNVSAEELLHAAELGQVVDHHHTRDLVIAAVHKAPDDPAVLANAYLQSAQGGWEQTAQNARWIETAAARSEADGPVKMVSLKELAEQKPAWDRQLSDVAQELRSGRLPSFVAANILKRSLTDFTLTPALANPTQTDVRKRTVVHAYSGGRPRIPIPAGASIALELGALFTLARLNLLDLVCRRFKVVVPQTTLSWLFRERVNSAFHQRSRIKDAKQLKHLVSSRVLSVVECPPNRDHELTKEVGKPLADMLGLAKAQSEAGTPTVVVRSAPIHRVGSLMFELADTSAYSQNIVSCATFLNLIKTRGMLTAQEEAHARAYLRTQEQPWPSEPSVNKDTQFCLDGLSIAYLRTSGVLSKIKGADVRVFIALTDDDDANSLLEMAEINDEQLTVIEGIRATLESGLTLGTTKAVRAASEGRDHEFQTHPTYSILALEEPVDALLIDDRAMNRNLQVEHEGRVTPIVTTLDLLDNLNSEDAISESELLSHRTRLRQCGFQIIPVTEVELRAHIYSAPITNGKLVETAELRAIRESLLQARMTRILQLPMELPALQTMRVIFISLAREVWQNSAGAEDAIARANWLLRVSDVRPWASVIEKTRVRDFVELSHAEMVLQLAFAPVGLNQARAESYLEWFTENVLASVQQGHPKVYELVLAGIKGFVTRCVEQGLNGEL